MRTRALVLAVALAAAPACSHRPGAAPGRVDVVAGFYPFAYVAERVGGDRVRVTNVTPSGAEPHDVDLPPGKVAQVARARVVLLVSGLQPSVDQAAVADRVLDMWSVVPGDAERAGDPHLWLDPVLMRLYVADVADRLAGADAGGASGYRERASRLQTELGALDQDYRTGLAHCARHDIVTTHAAFGWLADRYDLHQYAITGPTPDADPAPSRMAAATRFVVDRHVTTVFVEPLVPADVGETVARAAHAKVATLDPVESAAGPEDYLAVMRNNLAVLRAALGCA